MAKTLKVKLDDRDYAAIQEAIRRSGLFRVDGELIMPEGESDEKGATIVEICWGWTERMSIDVVGQARKEKTRP